jgi:2-methylisocitrate lyase-like PEP mutase family enzyme
MADQKSKHAAFTALHEGPAFVIPNPWDAGSAKLLASVGFSALATTSAGLAFAAGVPDGTPDLDSTLGNAAEIAGATALPVTADLGDGFADPAETVRRAAAVGLVGGSVEDAVGGRVLDLRDAVERVRAAAGAARGLPFTLTARAENFLCGQPDLDDTIARLRAYAEAGAHVLYAPGLPDLDAVAAVCAAVGRPVNALATGALSAAELAGAGVRRISTGSGLARVALTAAADAAREALSGTFTAVGAAMPHRVLNGLMDGG